MRLVEAAKAWYEKDGKKGTFRDLLIAVDNLRAAEAR
jgi:hypothetical protein